jgi:hypothetical protein
MPRDTLTHNCMAAAPGKDSECAVGWIVHYAISMAFALTFIVLASPKWLQQPALFPALLWGVATVEMPFFVMQPAFGLGVASSKTPNPTQARLRSPMTHTVFGMGLYISAVTLNFLLKANSVVRSLTNDVLS